MKYIVVVVDHKGCKGFDIHDLRANTLVEAMSEAERFWKGTVYLIRIAERVGRIERRGGHKIAKFREIICNRWHGWHPCDNEHSETSATWSRYESIKYPDRVSYELYSI